MLRCRAYRATYPPEFRTEAIRLARTSGRPHVEIARELSTTGETRRLWLKQADLDDGKRSDGPTSDEQEELRRLSASLQVYLPSQLQPLRSKKGNNDMFRRFMRSSRAVWEVIVVALILVVGSGSTMSVAYA